jgi:hypothetical protein
MNPNPILFARRFGSASIATRSLNLARMKSATGKLKGDPLKVTLVFAASIDDVWSSLTQSERTAAWPSLAWRRGQKGVSCQTRDDQGALRLGPSQERLRVLERFLEGSLALGDLRVELLQEE